MTMVVTERATNGGERGAWDVGVHRVSWTRADEFECTCRLARKKTEQWRSPAHCRHVAAVRQVYPALDATARHFAETKRALATAGTPRPATGPGNARASEEGGRDDG
ncbi:MAG: hypothetical protein H0X24_01620 [Ktedonobacterales bacterium]|nr:hypothetical protein [Ktedonobacterales bacterium]